MDQIIGLNSYSQASYPMLGERGATSLQHGVSTTGIGSGPISAFTSINRRVSPSSGGPAFSGQTSNMVYQELQNAGASAEALFTVETGASVPTASTVSQQGPFVSSYNTVNTTQFGIQTSSNPQLASSGFLTQSVAGQNTLVAPQMDMRSQGFTDTYRAAPQPLPNSNYMQPGQQINGLQYPNSAPGYPYPPALRHPYPPGPANLLNIMRPPVSIPLQQDMLCEWIDSETKKACGRKYTSMHEIVTHITVDHVGGTENDDHTCYWKGCDRDFETFKAKYKLINHIRYVLFIFNFVFQ